MVWNKQNTTTPKKALILVGNTVITNPESTRTDMNITSKSSEPLCISFTVCYICGYISSTLRNGKKYIQRINGW
jgi:hypothetical protein